jgi:hypothetical protein
MDVASLNRFGAELASTAIVVAQVEEEPSLNPLGDDLLPWIVLALGAALAVGTAAALLRPREDPEGNDLPRPPLARSVVMIVLGGVAAVWGLASLVS